MSEPSVTVRDCLRNALRRNGCMVPPPAEAIAAPLTDDELQELAADLLHILIMRKCLA